MKKKVEEGRWFGCGAAGRTRTKEISRNPPLCLIELLQSWMGA